MPSTRRMSQAVAGVAIAVLVSGCDATSGSRLHVRSGPSTANPVVATLGPAGTHVTIDCSTPGEPIRGNAVWYHITEPERGYVTSYYVRTDDTTTTKTIPAC
jgi:uncharacterized protein YraI